MQAQGSACATPGSARLRQKRPGPRLDGVSENDSKGGTQMRHSRIKPRHALALAVALAIVVPAGSSASSSQLPKCLDETPTIVGTPGDDFLVGTRDDDVIVGLEGNDVIEGIGGIDLICGNEGNDQI